ncbi:pirin family protein [Streptomyces sp. NP160]|uniref:pirin family protein n=1 Tax=Streptomyces sp. NP160 TaxID=2586637 RepID=UPI00214C2F61|nr:pirin family protein [Streptomyces sp. NP160]
MSESATGRLLEGRDVPLGGVRGMSVQRWLPHREVPTVGAWCFLDRIGPQRVDMRVQPHPHTALQTVTWPLSGEIHHRDSVGSDVVVRPGELNLMTAGRGVSHSEFSLGEQPLQHAVQLWVVLPREQDGCAPRFEQQRELPVVEVGGARGGVRATVLVGSLGGETSPAGVAPGLVGADVALDDGADVEVQVDPAHEHALLTLDPDGGLPALGHWAPGRTSLRLRHADGARQLLLGGVPTTDDLVMFWNFIGRTHEDVAAARADWEDPDAAAERFGRVPGHAAAERIPAPPLPPVRLTPRRPRPRRVVEPGEAPAFS